MTYIENIFLCLALPMLLSLPVHVRLILDEFANIGQPPALYPVRGAGHGHLPAFGLCQQLFHGAASVQCRDHRH